MKKLIAILTIICLFGMPVAISEEIEIAEVQEEEAFLGDIELDFDGEIGQNLSEDVVVLDLPETLLTGDEEAPEAKANNIPNAQGVFISEETFPDPSFYTYIRFHCDKDEDRYLSVSEIAAVVEMNVRNLGIESLEGIEFFSEIEVLLCENNAIRALDLRNNTKLTDLRCDDNRLSSLNISNSPELTTLFCRNNQLTVLDIRNNPLLDWFSCWGNSLQELDLSNNPILANAVREYGPMLREVDQDYMYYINPEARDDTDGPIGFDRNIRVYANGQLLYNPDKPIQRTVKPVTLGAGETDSNLLFYKGEAVYDTPYWLRVLSMDGKMTYESSDSRIVEVNNNKGTVKGIKTGKATIKVTSSKGVVVTCKVTVKKAPSSISLSKSKMTLMKGRKKDIKVRLSSGSACRELKWSSSNPHVAEYNDYYGSICAYAPGKAIITVKTYNGKKATCKVTVTAPEPTALNLNTTGLYLEVGKTFQIVPTIDEGTSTTFTYTSKNKRIASVSKKGLVKGIKAGTTKITVSTKNGLKKTFEVQVGNKGTYKSGTSGVRVYASLSDKYYHTKSNCRQLVGTPNRVTLETALNYGKKPCSECASSASKTVYVVKGGKYYHMLKSHAGSGAKKCTLAVALAYGYDACPECVG